MKKKSSPEESDTDSESESSSGSKRKHKIKHVKGKEVKPTVPHPQASGPVPVF